MGAAYPWQAVAAVKAQLEIKSPSERVFPRESLIAE